jgi:acyl-coenzyme A thioesterase PaaI-like protein
MRDNNLGQYPFVDILEISLESIDDKKIILRMKRNNVNVGGVRNSINGGILATYAEISSHVAINSRMLAGSEIKQTQDLSIAYLVPSALNDGPSTSHFRQ